MIEEIKNIKKTTKDYRNFGLLVGFALIVIYFIILWRKCLPFDLMHPATATGTALIIFAVLAPFLLKPFYIIWMIFATLLGWIMTRVILSILFYVVISPIGLISRLFGKRFLELKWDKTKGSYWNYRETKSVEKERYEKQF